MLSSSPWVNSGPRPKTRRTLTGSSRMMTVNLTWPAAALSAVADQMRQQGHGRIIVLSSVAGFRIRRSNYVYGSAKAGLDGFAQGLSEALRGTGVSMHIVRPGFVRTKMTAGRTPCTLRRRRVPGRIGHYARSRTRADGDLVAGSAQVGVLGSPLAPTSPVAPPAGLTRDPHHVCSPKLTTRRS